MEQIEVRTKRQVELIDITVKVNEIVKRSGVTHGICAVFIPHTTAAITINENADPSVVADMLDHLDRMVPMRGDYRHSEGNSPAHIKSTLVGCGTQVLIEGGALELGTWQSLFFCEFDGPRNRKVWVTVLGS
jgi:secondary thiamine-phosphate synthase enzyme